MVMKFEVKEPPRKYSCGIDGAVEISDCASVRLESDEQVTFFTPDGKEHDFTAKSWGFYATPSVNGRLKDQGLKTALVKNSQDRFYVMVVDADKLEEFNQYLSKEKNEVVEWLDER